MLRLIKKVACERRNSIACACAVARAFPLYSAKTGEKSNVRNVTVSFLFTDQLKGTPTPNDEEIECFNAMAQSIRLTARIIDTPCAEMNTDDFLQVIHFWLAILGLINS